MARKVTRKALKHDEFVEAAFDFERWIEEHWMPLAAVAGIAAALTLAVWGWSWWNGRVHAETARMLGEGLDGIRATDGSTPPAGDIASRYGAALAAFEKAAKHAPGSPAGGVAVFYQGAALLKLGRASEAIVVLEPLPTSAEGFLGDAARAELAWAYAHAGQTDRAVSAWKDLAARSDADYPPDLALYHAAAILSGAGRGEEARAVLQDLTTRFPQGPAFQDASKLLTKVGGTVAATVQ